MFTRSDRLRPNTKFSRLSGTESDKSFVDDFDMERGIVSMRVGLSYDLLRLSPCSGDLYTANCAGVSRNRNSLAPPIHQPTTIKQPPQQQHTNTTQNKFILYKNYSRGIIIVVTDKYTYVGFIKYMYICQLARQSCL